MNEYRHKPVLLNEILKYFGGCKRIVDCTIGLGGHSLALLEQNRELKILGIDQDNEAIEIARKKLNKYQDRVTLVNDHFSNIDNILKDNWNEEKINGILLDLGVSSMQLDNVNRGFSFNKNAKLDMRMSQDLKQSAFDIVNKKSFKELNRIFNEYGEERYSKQIARKIIKKRQEKNIETTKELSELIERVYSRNKKTNYFGKTHPATKVFQAIRIEVNQELEELKNILPKCVDFLGLNGILGIISFHSLEDRIVKQYFTRQSKGCICPDEFPVCACEHKARLKIMTKKPIVSKEIERKDNPRARSAKLRIVQKVL